MTEVLKRYNPYDVPLGMPPAATAETLMQAEQLSYSRRGELAIRLPKHDAEPAEKARKLHALAVSIANIGDTDAKDIQPIDREQTLIVKNPGGSLRQIVEAIITDHTNPKHGLVYDKSDGKPTRSGKQIVEAIQQIKTLAPEQETGRGRF